MYSLGMVFVACFNDGQPIIQVDRWIDRYTVGNKADILKGKFRYRDKVTD